MPAMLCITTTRLRGSAIGPASRLPIPNQRSAAANSITPPSKVIRPLSKSAMTFLRPTAANRNGAIVSSDRAGVAQGSEAVPGSSA